MKKADVYQTVTNNILAALENGIIPWRKPFKTSFSPIPFNFLTNKAYRGINVFLLNLACLRYGYPTNIWLTFNQAKKMGGNVKKGQSSENILFWKSKLIREQKTTQDYEVKESNKKVFIARIYNVFNIEQVEGIDKDGKIQTQIPRIGSCDQVYANYPVVKPMVNLGLINSAYTVQYCVRWELFKIKCKELFRTLVNISLWYQRNGISICSPI